jgi:hypothetical protein
MYQWSLVERRSDGSIRSIGVYDDFAMAVGQMFLIIDETIKDQYDTECYDDSDYKISELKKLECDNGYSVFLRLTNVLSNDETYYFYYLLCSEKKQIYS